MAESERSVDEISGSVERAGEVCGTGERVTEMSEREAACNEGLGSDGDDVVDTEMRGGGLGTEMARERRRGGEGLMR